MKNTLAIKQQLRKIKNFLFSLLNLLNGEPNLNFYSPIVALADLKHKYRKNHSQSTTTKLSSNLIDGISVHEEVISYPLSMNYELLKKEELWGFYGGLISSRTHELIEEANYLSFGSLWQDLPTGFNAQEIFSKDVPEIKDTVFYGGILFDHFGHFLQDSLTRLWAYEYVRELDPYIFFYVPFRTPDFMAKNNHVNQVLTGFKIPHKRVVFTNELVKLKKVIVPHQKYGHDYAKKPDSVFLDFVKSFRFKNQIPMEFENADRIYVSRTKLPYDTGRTIAEDFFEEYLVANGYKIFYPERYNLNQQLSVYSKVKKIIFLCGSALHGCILLPDLQADVAIIARNKEPGRNSLYQIGQFEGYGKAVLEIDVLRGQYVLGRHYPVALSDVDWYEASLLLERKGFVDVPFNDFNQLNYSIVEKHELQKYVQSNLNHPDFIDFMMQFKEYIPHK